MGDLDNDGDLDLITPNFVTQIATVYRNEGAGSFTPTQTLFASLLDSVGVGDFNGDGHLDLLLNPTRIALNTGNGVFSAPTSVINSFDPLYINAGFDVKVGDVDNDGDLDFVAKSFGDAAIVVGLNNGSGTSFTILTGYMQGNGFSETPLDDFPLEDFNNDGILDIIATGYDERAFYNAVTTRIGSTIVSGMGGQAYTSSITTALMQTDSDLSVFITMVFRISSFQLTPSFMFLRIGAHLPKAFMTSTFQTSRTRSGSSTQWTMHFRC